MESRKIEYLGRLLEVYDNGDIYIYRRRKGKLLRYKLTQCCHKCRSKHYYNVHFAVDRELNLQRSPHLKIPSETRIDSHRLIAAAFLGECPEGMEVDHINGNTLDNRAINLQYLTPDENRLKYVMNNNRYTPRIYLIKTSTGTKFKSIGDKKTAKIINMPRTTLHYRVRGKKPGYKFVYNNNEVILLRNENIRHKDIKT